MSLTAIATMFLLGGTFQFALYAFLIRRRLRQAGVDIAGLPGGARAVYGHLAIDAFVVWAVVAVGIQALVYFEETTWSAWVYVPLIVLCAAIAAALLHFLARAIAPQAAGASAAINQAIETARSQDRADPHS